jgi:hypothetical protein
MRMNRANPSKVRRPIARAVRPSGRGKARNPRLATFAGMVFIFALNQSNSAAEARMYRYRERTGTKTIALERTIEKSGNAIRLSYVEGDAASSSVDCRADYDHADWHYMRIADKTDFFMEKTGRTLKVSGILNGKPCDKSWELDGSPWYQTLEFALLPWLEGKDEAIRFWTVRPTDLELFKMIAIREGDQTIELEGERVDAIKVRVTLTGAKSVFWHADYWFRKSDLVFVRYLAVRGGPGTPRTEIVLIDG